MKNVPLNLVVNKETVDQNPDREIFTATETYLPKTIPPFFGSMVKLTGSSKRGK